MPLIIPIDKQMSVGQWGGAMGSDGNRIILNYSASSLESRIPQTCEYTVDSR